MHTILKLLLVQILLFGTLIYAQNKAPDEVVTKSDIKKCFKHIRETENFVYPESLKVESSHYTVEGSKILLTLSLSQKTEYGGNVPVQEKQCVIDNKSAKQKKETKPPERSYYY